VKEKSPRIAGRLLSGAAVFTVLFGLGVLASGCGSSGGEGVAQAPNGRSTTSGSTGGSAYSACMRRNGVSNFPDPGADGIIHMPSAIDKRSPTFQRASLTCRPLAPGRVLTEQERAQLQRQMLAFAACMRAHGVQFPDPSVMHGHIELPETAQRIDRNSHTFTSAAAACRNKLAPGYFSKLVESPRGGPAGGK
jgi:hypothetical protein